MVEYPLYVICASAPLASLVVLVGLTYSFLSIRVNVSHLCRRRLGYSFGGMYPLCVLTVCHSFNLVRDAVTVPVCFCLFLILYVSFVITTINQIKEDGVICLLTHAFTVVRVSKSEEMRLYIGWMSGKEVMGKPAMASRFKFVSR